MDPGTQVAPMESSASDHSKAAGNEAQNPKPSGPGPDTDGVGGLEHSNMLVPVTALETWGQFILAGVGQFLRVYEFGSGRLVAAHQIFKQQTVHGIAIQEGQDKRLMIWGGRLIALVECSGRDLAGGRYDLIGIAEAHDWILDVAPCWGRAFVGGASFINGKPEALLVTAHNSLCSLSSSQVCREGVQKRACVATQHVQGSKEILYSAEIMLLSGSRALIAAGTVFGKIVVWSCDFGLESWPWRVHHVFQGHEGSVFGVCISQRLSLACGFSRLLASCSDDRTIRLWAIRDNDDNDDDAPVASSDQTAKKDQIPAAMNDSSLAVSSMSHLSRVWKVRFITTGEDSGSIVDLVSAGEDATLQRWSVQREPDQSATAAAYNIRHAGTLCSHNGKNIWSLATWIRPGDCQTTAVLTGGADGRVTISLVGSSGTTGILSLSYLPDSIKTEGPDDSKAPIQETGSSKADVGIGPVADKETQRTSLAAEGDNARGGGPTGQTESAKKSDGKGARDAFRSYAFVGAKKMLLATNNGNLNLLTLAQNTANAPLSKDEGNFRHIANLQELKSYSVVASVPSLGICFLGAANGSLFAYDLCSDSLKLLTRVAGKVAGLFAQARKEKRNDERVVDLLVAVLKSTTHVRLVISFAPDGAELRELKDVDLPSQEGALVVTSALFVPVNTEPGSETASPACAPMLIVGFRDGRIVFHHSCGDMGHISKSCGRGDAITGLHWCPAPDSPSSAAEAPLLGWLYSAARDGFLRAHAVCDDQPGLRAHLVHELLIPLRPSLEGLYADSAGRLVVYGFHDTRFFVRDVADDWTLCSIECGGAHRTWAFVPDLGRAEELGTNQSKALVGKTVSQESKAEDFDYSQTERPLDTSADLKRTQTRGGTFAWTKAGRLCVESRPQLSTPLTFGGHGREIKACAFQRRGFSAPRELEEDRREVRLVATGAEDTDIRLFAVSPAPVLHGQKKQSPMAEAEVEGDVPLTGPNNEFRCIATLRKHNTGIQQLQWSDDGSLLFSCGGCEEFFVWRVRSLPLVSVGVVCESVCPMGKKGDLRIMGFNAQTQEPRQDGGSEKDETTFSIIMVFSDSTLEQYEYSSRPSSCEWKLRGAGRYLSACLMQISLFQTTGPEAWRDVVVTGATDGHIALWTADRLDLTGQAVNEKRSTSGSGWIFRHKIHQSAINALRTVCISPTTAVVLSCGDDNGVGITILSLQLRGTRLDSGAVTAKTLLIPRAHAAAVTALAPVAFDCNEPGKWQATLITAGNDQRVKSWRVEINTALSDSDMTQVKKLRSHYTPVADVAAMDTVPALPSGEDEAAKMAHDVLVCGAGMELWRAGAETWD